VDGFGEVELAPPLPDQRAVAADDPGHKGEGLAGQLGTVEKHENGSVL
jgi:hypothetical protein